MTPIDCKCGPKELAEYLAEGWEIKQNLLFFNGQHVATASEESRAMTWRWVALTDTPKAVDKINSALRAASLSHIAARDSKSKLWWEKNKAERLKTAGAVDAAILG